MIKDGMDEQVEIVKKRAKSAGAKEFGRKEQERASGSMANEWENRNSKKDG